MGRVGEYSRRAGNVQDKRRQRYRPENCLSAQTKQPSDEEQGQQPQRQGRPKQCQLGVHIVFHCFTLIKIVT